MKTDDMTGQIFLDMLDSDTAAQSSYLLYQPERQAVITTTKYQI